MMQRCVSGWLLSGLCLFSVGCGEQSNMAEVTGSVTINGEPVEKGSISFISVDGMSPTAGGIIEEGQYTSQAPLSEAKVEIRVPKVVGKKKLYDTPDSPVQEILEELLPSKYNEDSELRYTAERGKNEKDWELTVN